MKKRKKILTSYVNSKFCHHDETKEENLNFLSGYYEIYKEHFLDYIIENKKMPAVVNHPEVKKGFIDETDETYCFWFDDCGLMSRRYADKSRAKNTIVCKALIREEQKEPYFKQMIEMLRKVFEKSEMSLSSTSLFSSFAFEQKYQAQFLIDRSMTLDNSFFMACKIELSDKLREIYEYIQEHFGTVIFFNYNKIGLKTLEPEMCLGKYLYQGWQMTKKNCHFAMIGPTRVFYKEGEIQEHE